MDQKINPLGETWEYHDTNKVGSSCLHLLSYNLGAIISLLESAKLTLPTYQHKLQRPGRSQPQSLPICKMSLPVWSFTESPLVLQETWQFECFVILSPIWVPGKIWVLLTYLRKWFSTKVFIKWFYIDLGFKFKQHGCFWRNRAKGWGLRFYKAFITLSPNV